MQTIHYDYGYILYFIFLIYLIFYYFLRNNCLLILTIKVPTITGVFDKYADNRTFFKQASNLKTKVIL